MNDNLLITEDTIFQVPLLIPMANTYFEKIGKKENETYYRAIDLRLCLENICDKYIYEFIDDNDKQEWDKRGTTLRKKLDISKKYLDEDIVTALIDAKNCGNKGAHEGAEAIFKETEFEIAQNSIFDFSIEMLVFYFKKYGYAKLDNKGSWIPYVFSTLPPLYRVKVLRKYFETNPEPIVIEKLAMAYTKSKCIKEMKEFLDLCLSNGNINKHQYNSLIKEMKQIEENLENFPIAKNMKEAKENFITACNTISQSENLHQEPFILLMSLIFYGSKESIMTEKDKVAQITRDTRGCLIINY